MGACEEKWAASPTPPGDQPQGSKKIRHRSQDVRAPRPRLSLAPVKRLAKQQPPQSARPEEPTADVAHAATPSSAAESEARTGGDGGPTSEPPASPVAAERAVAEEATPSSGAGVQPPEAAAAQNVGEGAVMTTAAREAGPLPETSDPWEEAVRRIIATALPTNEPSEPRRATGWSRIVEGAGALEAIAHGLRGLASSGFAVHRELETRLAAAEGREKTAVADARDAEEKLGALLMRVKDDEAKSRQVVQTLEAKLATEAKARVDAEGVAAQLAKEVAQLRKSLEGLQIVVSQHENEVRGKGN